VLWQVDGTAYFVEFLNRIRNWLYNIVCRHNSIPAILVRNINHLVLNLLRLQIIWSGTDWIIGTVTGLEVHFFILIEVFKQWLMNIRNSFFIPWIWLKWKLILQHFIWAQRLYIILKFLLFIFHIGIYLYIFCLQKFSMFSWR
jgi:hypothetical protein